MHIHKRQTTFQIDPSHAYSTWWYQARYRDWEPESFDILDHFLRPDRDFIDIGAWIGPLALYAAQHSRCVYALEPDPVAFQALKQHLAWNADAHVQLFPVGLAESEGIRAFGGNGELGNSESTLLVNDPVYLSEGGQKSHWMGNNPQWRQGQLIQVPITPFSAWVKTHAIDLAVVSLIKVDIEGSEKYVLPDMLAVLKPLQLPLYLSLHWEFLKAEEISHLLDMLYQTYTQVRSLDFQPLLKEDIMAHQLSGVLAGPL
jgi:FkbM family methyltransferase